MIGQTGGVRGWTRVDLELVRGRIGGDQRSVWGRSGGHFECVFDLVESCLVSVFNFSYFCQMLCLLYCFYTCYWTNIYRHL